MHLSWIDWAIVACALVGLRYASLSTREHVQSVTDFLSANRSAGRYLVTLATGMSGFGAITLVGQFEMYYSAGFVPTWWTLMSIPVGIIGLLTGWVYYRFRETRAMTMAQFFEMRYSRNFRVFAGFVAYGCGVLNYAIFPAVTARFIVYFCGLPPSFSIPGVPFEIPTIAPIMIADIGLALMFVMLGGQIAVMVTDCVQGMFCLLTFIVLSFTVLHLLQWEQITQALLMAPRDASMINPYMTSQVRDFNFWYFAIGVFGAFYTAMAWQGTQGFACSAKSPHEQKMGGVIGVWRHLSMVLATVLLAIAAYTVMKLPEFSGQAESIKATLDSISNTAVRGQMQTPIALAYLLPTGIKGLLLVMVIFLSCTTHDSYLHSWGSIFVQDVIVPLRKKPLSPGQHLRWLRLSIFGVAVFAFFFSLLYPMGQQILMFFAITGTIWLGGAGAAIIGGLYWRRGTTPAAYSALVVGAVLGVSGLIIPQLYTSKYGVEFPINGQVLYLIGMLSAIAVYVTVSLVTSRLRPAFDITRMLHRDRPNLDEVSRKENRWLLIVGITDEFSFTDRILAAALLVWNVAWFGFFLVITIVSLIAGLGNEWWLRFWKFYVYLYLGISVPVFFWFTIGGIRDIKHLFKTLENLERDHTDDGRVVVEPVVCEAEAAQVKACPAMIGPALTSDRTDK